MNLLEFLDGDYLMVGLMPLRVSENLNDELRNLCLLSPSETYMKLFNDELRNIFITSC